MQEQSRNKVILDDVNPVEVNDKIFWIIFIIIEKAQNRHWSKQNDFGFRELKHFIKISHYKIFFIGMLLKSWF